jgi:hypothetical protein
MSKPKNVVLGRAHIVGGILIATPGIISALTMFAGVDKQFLPHAVLFMVYSAASGVWLCMYHKLMNSSTLERRAAIDRVTRTLVTSERAQVTYEYTAALEASIKKLEQEKLEKDEMVKHLERLALDGGDMDNMDLCEFLASQGYPEALERHEYGD